MSLVYVNTRAFTMVTSLQSVHIQHHCWISYCAPIILFCLQTPQSALNETPPNSQGMLGTVQEMSQVGQEHVVMLLWLSRTTSGHRLSVISHASSHARTPHCDHCRHPTKSVQAHESLLAVLRTPDITASYLVFTWVE